jgi:hypothetical protein
LPQGTIVIPSSTRLALIDRATNLGDRISPPALMVFLRHLRRADLNVCDWHRCADLADSGAITHHQARTVAAQLVRGGLLERRVVPRRLPGGQDGRYTAYRLILPGQEGAAQ